MQNLTITTIQSNLIWENAVENRTHFDKLIATISNPTDLIILPEMFTTGFSMTPTTNAEKMEGTTMQWMKYHASNLNAVVTGSIIIEVESKYYNRLIWMRPDGSYETYDKRHLFTLAGEEKHYTAGTDRKIIELNGWKICPLVCYDLRFPVWARNNVGYDLVFYVANWPNKRINAWRGLLTGRAIENQSYTIGVNRVGEDGSNLNYNGMTSAISYDGTELYAIEDIEAVKTIELNYQEQQDFRKKLAFLDDQDEFSITL